ncbi:MAG: HlyC/CorC family transporter [Holophagaceae bacterium]|nr:HlyC/CorC family transporter [Holophagaceae bacterium]
MTGGALVITPILIGLTAFFVLAEFSAVRVRPTQLEAIEKSDPRASLALKVHHELGRHLSSIQVAITLLTIAVGATGEEAMVRWFHGLFGAAFPWPRVGWLLGSVSGFLLITVMQVVLAELVPRGIAIRQATTWALRTAAPLLLWSSIVKPFTWILQKLSRAVVWLLGMKLTDEPGDANLPSEEELRRMLERSQESGQLGLSKVELIDNLFGFSRRTIKEIAIPRTQVVCFDLNHSLEENLVLARSSPHTRIPLVDGDLDQVVGIVHLKELLWALHERGGEVDIRDFARPAFLVPEMKLIQDLLLEFQQQKQHLALMVNEHGGVDGLVTLEDVLEELVGEIQDEFDLETIQLRKTRSGAWLAQGLVSLEQLVDHLGLDLAVEEGSISLGGYFQEQLGRVLRVGDELKIHGWRIRVLAMRGLAPSQFLLKPLKGGRADGGTEGHAEPRHD